jgi:hypothetical protein
MQQPGAWQLDVLHDAASVLCQLHVAAVTVNLAVCACIPAAAAAAANISGSIPPELGSMTALQELDLSTNYLTGTIPPQLGNLANLHSLKYADNRQSIAQRLTVQDALHLLCQ